MLTNLHSVTDYARLRYDSIKREENYIPEAYVDSHKPNGIPTIGVGCNIQIYFNLVLRTLGFDVDRTQLTGSADIAEQGYIRQIRNIIYAQFAPNSTTALRNALRPIMTARAGNVTAGYPITFYRGSSFRFNGEAEARIVFDVCVQENEKRVDQWLGTGNILGQSYERIALVSLAFSSRRGQTDVLGTNLKAAIINDNRAEAWYQIRYVSNGDYQHGNRRYREAYLFGLYDSGTTFTETEAKEIMRMYTRYEIFGANSLTAYENKYHLPSNIVGIHDMIWPANNYLIQNYAKGTNINGWVIVGRGLDVYNYIEKGHWADDITGQNNNDLIFGEKGIDKLNGGVGDDVIYGGEGNDTLIGGTGNDLLMGGANNDKYIVNAGEGTDTIEDKQGDNTVILCGRELNFFYNKGGYQYKNADGSLTAVMQGTDLEVTHMNGTKVILNENFEWGDFGINLIDGPADPNLTNTIYGTSDNDHLYDTAFNDLIDGGQGDDTIEAISGGNNELSGGEGNDALGSYVANSKDLIEGGTGNDILFGGPDNDQVFGEYEGDMDNLITAGEAASSINIKGDLASGGTGNDFIYTSDTNDLLLGGEGLDLLTGSGGNDVILGDAEYTTAFGDWSVIIDNGSPSFINVGVVENDTTGDDVIYAGTGNDVVWGEGGDDEIYGGEGEDTLTGDAILITPVVHGGDYIDGGEGNDVVWGQGGSDTIYGGEGDDILSGDAQVSELAVDFHCDDYIDGEAGNDTLYGSGGSDTIHGGDGADTLFGDADDVAAGFQGDDYLDGESGNDTLYGYGGNDTLYGGEDSDSLYGDEGDDYIDGESGADTLLGGEGNDTIYGGEGDDWLQGGAGDDYIEEESGQNTILAGAGNDEVYGGIDIDWIQGDNGDDYIDGGEEADTILGGAGNDEIYGGEGRNRLEGGEGDDAIEGGADTDIILGNAGADTIYGNEGDDELHGDAADTPLNDQGNDEIYGGDGNDLINGYAGNDTLTGGEGNDTYYFNSGYGIDTIDDISVESGQNTVLFGEGISINDLTLNALDDRLVFNVGSQGDRLELINFDPLDWLGDHAVGTFQFSNGTTISYEDLIGEKFRISGTTGDDTLTGNDSFDNVVAGEGNDTLYGMGSSDMINGGYGMDTMYGGTGNDRYYVDNTGDTVIEMPDEGIDTVYSAVTYTIPEHVENLILSGYASKTGKGNDLNNTIKGSNGKDYLFGGNGDDVLSGGEDNDYLSGGEDNDTLYGNEDDDTLNGNEGDDMLDGGTGIDSMYGGTGDDIYIVDNANDEVKDCTDVGVDTVLSSVTYTLPDNIENLTLTGSGAIDGTGNILDNIITGNSGSNMLTGGDGNDTLEGGEGNDWLQGGNGDDQYICSEGMGDDTIFEYNGVDKIMFDGAYSTNFTFFLSPYPFDQGIVAKNILTNETTLIKGWFKNNESKIEHFQFTDTDLTGEQVEAMAIANGTGEIENLIYGTSGDDVINGTCEDSYILGNEGNDNIFGDYGNDYIDGGAGNDYLHGGNGNDIYFFNTGSGLDYIENNASDYATTIDIVQFGMGITEADLELIKDVYNLQIKIRGTEDLLGIWYWFWDDDYKLDLLCFADNTIMTALQIEEHGFTINGSDTYGDYLEGFRGKDKIYGFKGDDHLYGNEGDDAIYGGDGNDGLNGGEGNDILDGGAGNDRLNGGEGNDILDGSAGNDWLYGSEGNDTYVFDRGYGTDTIHNLSLASGVDTVLFGSGITLDDLEVTGHVRDIHVNIIGTTDLLVILNQMPVGSETIKQFKFADNTVMNVDQILSLVTRVYGTADYDNLYPYSNQSTCLYGYEGVDWLYGSSVDDTLDGGSDVDTMEGGKGNDTYYVDNAGDTVTEATDAGTDTVRSYISYALGSNIENLTLLGTSAINGTGNEFNNYITGNSGNNILTGGAGNDTLNGAAGIDTMYGGAGNDSYYIDNLDDIVTENVDEGTDRIYSPFSYTLDPASNIENLTLLGTSAINGTGNEFNNSITGNSGNNILTGGAGNDTLNGAAGIDTMIGGAGNDSYYIDNPGDIVTENADEGTDRIYSSIAYTLTSGCNIENLTLTGIEAVNGTGNEFNNSITGNSACNILTGGAGNDTLNGAAGIDTMIGGTGNDSYYIDNLDDIVTENADEGTDRIYSSFSYTLDLASNIENLTLTGTEAINGTGNEFNNSITGNSAGNILTGNAGNDTLNGGTGMDTMIGGTGNDSYYIDNPDDIVTENVDEGTDRIYSPFSYTLDPASNIENLTLTGTESINGTGNEFNNSITGNSAGNILTGGAGNDTLNGAAGIDTMIGGAGNDSYYIDNPEDIVTENADEGTDRIYSPFSYTLDPASNIENLTLTGTEAINGTGNEFNNSITGNSAGNILTGGAGNDYISAGAGDDTLYGGAGNDTLVGGTGNNIYSFSSGNGRDTIAAAGADNTSIDKVKFTDDVFKETIAIFQSGSNLVIGYSDTDRITINQSSSDHNIDTLELSNGQFLTDADINLIIQQMTSFAADNGITLTSVDDVKKNQDLMNMVVNAWQG